MFSFYIQTQIITSYVHGLILLTLLSPMGNWGQCSSLSIHRETKTNITHTDFSTTIHFLCQNNNGGVALTTYRTHSDFLVLKISSSLQQDL